MYNFEDDDRWSVVDLLDACPLDLDDPDIQEEVYEDLEGHDINPYDRSGDRILNGYLATSLLDQWAMEAEV